MDGLNGARIILVPESNLAFEGIWIQQEVNRSGLEGICVMREDDNRAGVKINKDFKKLMAMALNYKLQERGVCFHTKFVCIGEKNTPESMMAEIVDQLLNYSRIITPSNNKHRSPTETYGGKMGHGYDDHAIAVQLNFVMKNRFYQKEDVYKKWY